MKNPKIKEAQLHCCYDEYIDEYYDKSQKYINILEKKIKKLEKKIKKLEKGE